MSKQAQVAVTAPAEDEEDELAPLEETREERFKRVGERRMTRILKEFELLENLASGNYSFGEAEFEALFDTLESGVARLKERFSKTLRREAKVRPVFKF